MDIAEQLIQSLEEELYAPTREDGYSRTVLVMDAAYYHYRLKPSISGSCILMERMLFSQYKRPVVFDVDMPPKAGTTNIRKAGEILYPGICFHLPIQKDISNIKRVKPNYASFLGFRFHTGREFGLNPDTIYVHQDRS